MKQPLVVSFGGGVNSAAMLIGMCNRNITPDLILFADTGGEKPETYRFLETMRRWTRIWLRRDIVTVRASTNTDASLEESCLRLGVLPAIAYGWKTCSQRWKVEPQDKYLNSWEPAQSAWGAGVRVRKAIGFDAGEQHRAKDFSDNKYELWFPLIEWGWGRPECLRAFTDNGFYGSPGKSACFFCPSSKKHEVLRLKLEHPDLFERAVAIERGAEAKSTAVRGLGRRWAWSEIAKADEAQFKLLPEAPPIPCMCFDGEEDEVPA